MLYKIIVSVILTCALTACSANDGNAPSHDTPIQEPVVSDTDSFIKYTEIAQSSNGWEVTLDTSDSAEVITLANGWEVEALSE